MNGKPNPKRRGRRNFWGARLLITSLAVASTIGFWNLFSRQMALIQAVATSQPIEPTTALPAEPMVLELPPLPTLIPTLDGQIAQTNFVPQNVVNTSLQAQSFQPGTKIILGGAKPQAGMAAPIRASAPAPITNTQSSQ